MNSGKFSSAMVEQCLLRADCVKMLSRLAGDSVRNSLGRAKKERFGKYMVNQTCHIDSLIIIVISFLH